MYNLWNKGTAHRQKKYRACPDTEAKKRLSLLILQLADTRIELREKTESSDKTLHDKQEELSRLKDELTGVKDELARAQKEVTCAQEAASSAQARAETEVTKRKELEEERKLRER